MAGSESNFLKVSRKNTTTSSDTVVLSISFIGPLASIVEGDDVTIYAPRLEKHVASAETNTNEVPLEGDADYELSGLPTATGESIKIFPPIPCNGQDPYTEAKRLRNFTVTLKRPDVLQGIRPVDVFLSNRSTVPADARMQTLPTGVRFIYRDVPRNIALRLTGPNNFQFAPSFDLEEQAGTRQYELIFRYRSLRSTDPCHQDATASFKKLLEMFPESGIRSIKFAHNDPSCAMQASQAKFHNTVLRTGGTGDQQRARLLPVIGPGDDCQGTNMGSW